MPATLKPQLALLAGEVPTGPQWLHEVKFDGYRLLCFAKAGEVRLQTRAGNDWTSKFPQVATAIAKLPVDSAVFDGEVVAVNERGVPSFQALQNALRGTQGRSLQVYLFDLPYCDGYNLMRTPLIERKQLLEHIINAQSKVSRSLIAFSAHVSEGSSLFQKACELGMEGLVSKLASSEYVCKRSSSWVKIKCIRRQEFVIAGYTDPSGSRVGFGSLVLGYNDRERGELVYAGNVGTGFDDATLADLTTKLKRLQQHEMPFSRRPTGLVLRSTHWVQPKFVAEVSFSEWTDDGRLRHPSYVGLRADKKAAEIVREKPVHVSADSSTSNRRSLRPSRVTTGKRVEVAGVEISNPDRIVYPDDSITKMALARYYEKFSKWILPHIIDRPLTLIRCPEGIAKPCFFQRHVNQTLPEAVRALLFPVEDQSGSYILIKNLPGLIALVQINALEIHPWGSRAVDLDRPDRLVFDLDPGPGVNWRAVIDAAVDTRDVLAAANLKSFVQTSGGKGLHVIVPLTPKATWDQAKQFCHAIALVMQKQAPNKYTAILSKSKREGKIFIDYLRNGRGATSIATYSTRARKGAAVATPLRWNELRSTRSADQYSIKNLSRRLASKTADPWPDYFKLKQALPVS